MSQHQSKESLPDLSVIGSGRLGSALAVALASAGYSVKALVAQRSGHARSSAKLLDAPALALAFANLDKLPSTSLTIIAVPDDAIAETAKRLARIQVGKVRNRYVLHTSGALSSSVLKPLREKGFHVGSLHPLVAVSDRKTGSRQVLNAFWCVEGDKAAQRVARAIVQRLKGKSFSVPANKKPLYHAAAVMASGNVVALLDLAIAMLVRCGLKPKEAQEVLLPLVESTVRNLAAGDPARALTGTFARADFETAVRHLEAMKKFAPADALEIYKLLGLRSLKLSEKRAGKSAAVKELRRLLNAG
jgi:predicted short-subunit dehydrogenase-like oxidoreductase (DUF2520 family)